VIVWQAVGVAPRDPREIQLEIDAARESLAGTLDQLVYRGSPQRLTTQAKEAAVRFLQSPPGMAVVGGVGLLITAVGIRKVVQRRQAKKHPVRTAVQRRR
jgi:hypothetical protein